jgi:hypothetical protein
LVPYLLNAKGLSEDNTAKALEEWLNKCNNLRKLGFDQRSKVYSIIRGNKGYNPISFSKLKEENGTVCTQLNSNYYEIYMNAILT